MAQQLTLKSQKIRTKNLKASSQPQQPGQPSKSSTSSRPSGERSPSPEAGPAALPPHKPRLGRPPGAKGKPDAKPRVPTDPTEKKKVLETVAPTVAVLLDLVSTTTAKVGAAVVKRPSKEYLELLPMTEAEKTMNVPVWSEMLIKYGGEIPIEVVAIICAVSFATPRFIAYKLEVRREEAEEKRAALAKSTPAAPPTGPITEPARAA